MLPTSSYPNALASVGRLVMPQHNADVLVKLLMVETPGADGDTNPFCLKKFSAEMQYLIYVCSLSSNVTLGS